jgi:hypothetical protein
MNKPAFCALLILVILTSTAPTVHGGSTDALQLKIVETSPSATVIVQLRNPSDRPIRIWKESNSWGTAHWRVLVLRKGKLLTFFQNPDQHFTKNNPAYDELSAGGKVDRKLDLNEGNWRADASEGKAEFASGDTVIVIYDVPKVFPWQGAKVTVEASNMGVWYGFVSASTTVQ